MTNRGMDGSFQFYSTENWEKDGNGDIQYVASVQVPIGLMMLDESGDFMPIVDIQNFDDEVFERDANGDIQEKV